MNYCLVLRTSPFWDGRTYPRGPPRFALIASRSRFRSLSNKYLRKLVKEDVSYLKFEMSAGGLLQNIRCYLRAFPFFLFQGERSTLGTMSLRSLSQSSLSPRRSSRGSLASSRGSLGRSNESLPTANRSATADAIFMEEFGQGDKDAAAVREGKVKL